MSSPCSVPDCSRAIAIRGWCSMHYQRWRRHGDPQTHYPGVRRSVDVECRICGTVFSAQINQIERGEAKNCSRRCKYESLRGRRSHNAAPIGTKRVRYNGYVEIKVVEGDSHWPLEHRHVMEQALGRSLGSSEHVHHVNSDKTDNRLENLALYSNSDHQFVHQHWKAWTKKHVELTCKTCGAAYTRRPSHAAASNYCSNACKYKGMSEAYRRKAAQRLKGK